MTAAAAWLPNDTGSNKTRQTLTCKHSAKVIRFRALRSAISWEKKLRQRLRCRPAINRLVGTEVEQLSVSCRSQLTAHALLITNRRHESVKMALFVVWRSAIGSDYNLLANLFDFITSYRAVARWGRDGASRPVRRGRGGAKIVYRIR